MLLLELRPSALQEARLDDILGQLAAAFVGRARIPAAIDVEVDCELPAEVRVAFYRIAQEALNNVAKHAEATQVALNLRCRRFLPTRAECEATLNVIDDGRGFDLGEVSLDRLGLGIMRERAEAIGAALTIESLPGQGARVTVTWRSGKE
jgi:signal transduction histidine kinase